MQGYLSLFRKSIFKYKVTYPMQTDLKFAIFFFDMYFNEGGGGGGGEVE